MHRVLAAPRILVAENLDAQQAHHGRDPVTVLLQLGIGRIALLGEIHFAAADQFIEKLEGQTILADHRLELAVHRKTGRAPRTRPPNILAPLLQSPRPVRDAPRVLVGDVIHLPAERIERRHPLAPFAGQEDEGQREIGTTATGDGSARLHGGIRGHQRSGFGKEELPVGTEPGSPS